MKNIKNHLVGELKTRGMTVPQLAVAIGMSESAMYRRLRGEVAFSNEEITLIAKLLNLPGEKILFIFFDL